VDHSLSQQTSKDDLRLVRAVAWSVILCGWVLRLFRYFQASPLAVDEQLVTLNIVRRSFAGLLSPLSLAQSAPPLFLWVERGAVLFGGVNEYALRLVPLTCGLLFLPLTWRLAERLLCSRAALLTVGLVAVSPLLTWQSAFVKPYSGDALVTIVLMSTASWAARRTDARAQLALASVGVVAIGLSLPSLFVLGGMSGMLLISGIAITQRARWLLPVVSAWSVAGVTTIFTTHREYLTERTALAPLYMLDFWDRFFLVSRPPGLLHRAHDIGSDLFRGIFAGDPAFFPQGIAVPGIGLLLALTAVAGAAVLLRRRQFSLLTLLVAPLALASAASAFELYPAAARLSLWASAPLAMLVGVGGAVLSARIRGGAPAVLIIGALLFLPGALAQRTMPNSRLLSPRELPHAWPESQAVYVSPGGVPGWLFYSTNRNAPDLARVDWGMKAVDLGGPAAMFRWRRSTVSAGQGLASTLLSRQNSVAELIGRASGLDFVHDERKWRTRPDPDWATGELGRLKAVARPCVELLLIDIHPAEYAALHEEIGRAAGVVRTRVTNARDHRAMASYVERVCFSSVRRGTT